VAIVLTGVGYIGAELLGRLLGRGERVVGLDNFYSTPRDAIPSADGFELVEGDVADPHDVSRAFDRAGDCPLVYHLAAQPSAALAVRDAAYTERANLTGARLVLQTARDRGARVVFGGSFRVYGDELDGQDVSEQTPYGRVGDLSHLSKLYVEQLGRMLGGRFASVRLGVVYGRSPVMKSEPPLMTVPNLFCQRAAAGQPLDVLQDRSLAFIHVSDAAEALVQTADLLGRAAAPAWQVVNAAPQVATIGRVALTVQQLAARRGWQVAVRGAGATTTSSSFTVQSRLAAAGFRPRRTMVDGLPDVLDLFAPVAA